MKTSNYFAIQRSLQSVLEGCVVSMDSGPEEDMVHEKQGA